MWNPARSYGRVPLVLRAEFPKCVALLGMREANVHPCQERQHGNGENGRPLQQEAEHNRNEADVLRMSYPGVDPGCRKLMLTLCLVQHSPRCGEENEPCKNQQITQNVQYPRVGIPVMMKTAELIITRLHSPYADMLS